jgi:hypothetical protein
MAPFYYLKPCAVITAPSASVDPANGMGLRKRKPNLP